MKKRQFSVAICPDPQTNLEVKVLKELLRSQIGNYESCNSEAHISYRALEANDAEIKLYENHLKDFCRKQSNIEGMLNQAQFWKGGTLCLLPDEVSKNNLIQLMLAFRKFSGIRGGKSFSPHVSVARNLKEEQVDKIASYWEAKRIAIPIRCNNLTIREFDPDIKQYKVYKRIPFGK